MNLNAIAGAFVSAVAPHTRAILRRSTGSVTASDGSRVGSYAPDEAVRCQIQPMQWTDLNITEGLGIQGVRTKIYVNARWEGVVRVDRRGGDVILTPDGRVWLVVVVLEEWPGWSCVAVTLQDGS